LVYVDSIVSYSIDIRCNNYSIFMTFMSLGV
jgi:hypothetical protein